MRMPIAVDPVGQSPLQALGNNSIILLNSNIIHYHHSLSFFRTKPAAPRNYDNIISQAFVTTKRIDPDLKKKLLKLLRKVEEEDEGYLFADPVTDDIAPGYSKIIREPMDFQKINSKFQNRMYENIDQLRDDMYKMFDNCEQYNEPDSCFVVEAHRLREVVDNTIAEIIDGNF